ncbi:caspase family protein [Streptomyces sp. NPDC019990]|uniref:caspase family protein n=1 Tax=Streptomyces sp. NPDC019990 TaxID=3154693 RepID=UPI0033C586B3
MNLPDPVRSRAVLIGVDSYEHLENLPSVRRGVRRLDELLQADDLWGLPKKHCTVLHVRDQSPAEVLDIVREAAAAAEDAFLLYFAGHGLVSVRDGQGLLLALPKADRMREHWALPFDQLRHALVDWCTASRRVVILDCCFSGRALQGYMSPPADLAALADIDGTSDGTYVMTSCSETGLSSAPEDEEFTAFSGELIKALERGVAGGPDPLGMDALFKHLDEQLQRLGHPRPQRRVRNDGQLIALTRNRWKPPPEPKRAAGKDTRDGREGRPDPWRAARREKAHPVLDMIGTEVKVAAVLLSVLLVPALIFFVRENMPSPLRHQRGDKPEVREAGCAGENKNSITTCFPYQLTWRLPASRTTSTTLALDSDTDKRDVTGTLRLGDGCDAAVKWSLTAGELDVAHGVLTARDSERELSRFLATDAMTMEFRAERADTAGCTSVVAWEDATLQ